MSVNFFLALTVGYRRSWDYRPGLLLLATDYSMHFIGATILPNKWRAVAAPVFFQLPGHNQGTRTLAEVPSKIMRFFLIYSRSLLLHRKNEW